jgi:hypothetical protein
MNGGRPEGVIGQMDDLKLAVRHLARPTARAAGAASLDPVAKCRVRGLSASAPRCPERAWTVATRWWRPRPPLICGHQPGRCSYLPWDGGLPSGDSDPVGHLGLGHQVPLGGSDGLSEQRTHERPNDRPEA